MVDDQESRPSKRCNQGIIFTIKRLDPSRKYINRRYLGDYPMRSEL